MKIYVRIDRTSGVLIVKANFGQVPASAWRQFLRESWKKRRYWVQRQGTRRSGRLQILDRFIEWNVVDPLARRLPADDPQSLS
jgi:hypothetical protein